MIRSFNWSGDAELLAETWKSIIALGQSYFAVVGVDAVSKTLVLGSAGD